MGALEKPCPKCNGTKMVMIPDIDGKERQVYCPHCRSTGLVPSAEGLAVLDFITKYTNAFVPHD